MLWWEVSIFVTIVWNFLGFIILCVTLPMSKANSWQDMINFIQFHKTWKVNWFGAVICSFFMNFVCPIASLCSWMYFLCTVGR